jgi:uncharacterized protein (DUF1501 family)
VSPAHAQAAADYKALVCVFLFGGNDGNNTIVPSTRQATRSTRRCAAARRASSSRKVSLLPIQPASSSTPYGLHPSLPSSPRFSDSASSRSWPTSAR